MISTSRILALSIVTILLLFPSALTAQTPVPSGVPSAEHGAEVAASDVAEALAPTASPLLFKPGQGLLIAGNAEIAEHVPVPLAFQQERDRRTSLSLIAAGATLLVTGAFIDGSAGDVVMVTGALFSAVGVYRWVR